jgi:hypothetical protein
LQTSPKILYAGKPLAQQLMELFMNRLSFYGRSHLKKLLIVTVLFFLFCHVLFGSEEKNNNWTLNLSPITINLLNFDEENVSTSVSTSIASSMLSFSIGIGYHLNIIPNVFSPGIYVDVGLGYFGLLSDTNDDATGGHGGVWAGIRLYNLFRLNSIEMQPFIGLTLYGFSELGLPTTTYGILFAYERFGLEYSFHMPLSDRDKIFYIHRISFLWHIV